MSSGFYGVYLLVSQNPSFLGYTYIGFTVDPFRRIRQHNRGTHAQGAHKTSKRGPWSMVLVVHGFPNEVSALRVEWAWQHPEHSRCLKDVSRKKSSESRLDYALRLLGAITQREPWRALPLTITWLDLSYKRDFPSGCTLPRHITVKVSSVDEVKKTLVLPPEATTGECGLCGGKRDSQDTVTCGSSNCSLKAHVVCFAKSILRDHKQLLPIEGHCPTCGKYLVWGERVRGLSVACASSRGGNRGKGVYGGNGATTSQEESEEEESDDEDHWTNMLTQKN